jgi:hypothetical protein
MIDRTARASKTFVKRSRLFSACENLDNPKPSPTLSPIPNKPASAMFSPQGRSYAT